MTRKCEGCGGSGHVGCARFASYHSHEPGRSGSKTYYHAFACDILDCSACLGAGVVEERIPAADAMADAETLHSVGGRAVQIRHDLDFFGFLRHPVATHCQSAYNIAWQVARAAFRAVPGLREA